MTPRLSRDELITLHLPLVEHVLRTVLGRLHHGAGDWRDELRSAGFLGLIQAADRFNRQRGVTFKTFAWPRIEGAVVDELRDSDRVTRSERTQNKAGLVAAWQLQQELGREPERNEVADRIGLTVERYERIARIYSSNELDPVLEHQASSDDIEGEAIARQQLERVMSAIVTLPRRLQLLVVLYYFEDRTMSDIADEFGVGISRMWQLHHKAVQHLRFALGLASSLRTQSSLVPATEVTSKKKSKRLCSCARCVSAREGGGIGSSAEPAKAGKRRRRIPLGFKSL